MGIQRKYRVKTLRSPLSTEFFEALRVEWPLSEWRYNNTNIINNNSFLRVGIALTTFALHSHTCAPAPRRPHHFGQIFFFAFFLRFILFLHIKLNVRMCDAHQVMWQQRNGPFTVIVHSWLHLNTHCTHKTIH